MFNRKAAIVVALLTVSLFSTPNSALAETKKTKDTNTSAGTSSSAAKKDKVEKIKCKTTRATAQTPARIAPPSAILKKFPRTITLQTNCGDIVIQTYARQAPITITVMSALANGRLFQPHALSPLNH